PQMWVSIVMRSGAGSTFERGSSDVVVIVASARPGVIGARRGLAGRLVEVRRDGAVNGQEQADDVAAEPLVVVVRDPAGVAQRPASVGEGRDERGVVVGAAACDHGGGRVRAFLAGREPQSVTLNVGAVRRVANVGDGAEAVLDSVPGLAYPRAVVQVHRGSPFGRWGSSTAGRRPAV